MAAGEKVLNRCPVCGVQSFVAHCDRAHCGWMKCRSQTCDAVIDMTKKRGHARDNSSGDITTRRRVVIA